MVVLCGTAERCVSAATGRATTFKSRHETCSDVIPKCVSLTRARTRSIRHFHGRAIFRAHISRRTALFAPPPALPFFGGRYLRKSPVGRNLAASLRQCQFFFWRNGLYIGAAITQRGIPARSQTVPATLSALAARSDSTASAWPWPISKNA